MEEKHNPFAPPEVPVETPEMERAGKLLPHEKAGRAIRLVALIGILVSLAIGLVMAVPSFAVGRVSWIGLAVTAVPLALTTGLFMTGNAVMRHEHWARVVAIVFGVLALPAFPVGTIVGLYVLWYLVFHWELDGRTR